MAQSDSSAELQQPDLSVPTSTSLLDGLRARQPDAWRKLVALYGPFVYGWCRRWRIERAEAQDIVQEVFRAVAAGIGRFCRDRPGGTFRGWLWTIARNEASKYFSARGKRPTAAGGTDAQWRMSQVPDELDVPAEDSPPAGELVATMRRALDLIRGDFEAHTWQAFWRTAIDGHSSADVAQDLGMTKLAVRQAKHRVLGRLRDEFGHLID